ncbi:chemotaxis response regulator protein-glutamate methylesterase [Jeotgalibacillus sp. ET6]|uniref:protein-glutamate methylesterase/protein-glutamine glutaminase n=1 Tax=Jeotgalibacillus sp. ET6 TaxID=3037260 RepID=UPI0024181E34|nr:chemotaxis response regulator protein-glutamate methylesterase [Jeotgalibacillus sp. ET6]MDG5470309.1 chemotaxis response regulator protein-glutamate methylesterase [Jeotgalibacillus sp. ET6]
MNNLRLTDMIKVLVVDDSAFMRKLIQEFLREEKNITVVGTARNGEDALIKVKLLQPDVITMDVQMPVLNGLEALKKIMEDRPLPVIMLSSSTKDGAEDTLSAMDYGAVDFISKPSGTISLDLHKVKSELIEKVYAAAGSVPRKQDSAGTENSIEHTSFYPTIENEIKTNNKANMEPEAELPVAGCQKVVLIGTSTGGPRALQKVVSHLPKDLGAPVVIVQHMPAGFTRSLASRLNTISPLHVKEAEQGDTLQNDTVYLAPGGYHLTFDQSYSTIKIVLTQEHPRAGHRPSVDVMLETAAELKKVKKIVVIMTGMGTDGSKGLVQLTHKGLAGVIAESQETCIVHGMPKAAVATGLVNAVCPLPMIAKKIVEYVNDEG